MKDKILKVIQIILVIIIIACVGYIGKKLYRAYTTKSNQKQIKEIVDDVSIDYESMDNNLSDFEKKELKYKAIVKKLHDQNPDVVGFLEIPGTYVSYPIMQGEDNEFYLDKGVDKEYDEGGSVFMDYKNDREFLDDNTVLYGHHMWIDAMFTALDDYRDQEFAQNHTTLYVATLDELTEYKVFSAYGVPSDYDYRTMNLATGEEKIQYFNKLKDNSEVSIDIRDFNADDRILTLSTCQYDYEDQRLAVHALRLKNE